ncbi:hypothetical protein AHF37_08801 [Paragonimus kellicotti]|nr:hypothetical protein AHF37_08801 [Paragonimus kellicotti]
MENKTMQVQTDVCSQITSLVPWYQALKNGSTCTVTIGEQRVHANYTILTTDDFLRKYDPSCVTYDILLANQVRLSPAFANQYYLSEIQLETRNRTQPAGLSGTGSTSEKTICTVSASGSEQRELHKHRTTKNLQRAKSYESNSNGGPDHIQQFHELVKASLDSRFFYSNTSYLWKQVNILDGRSADTTTASPAPEQTSTSSGFVTTVRTTTRGDEKSDGRSADTTTASPAPEQTSTSSGFRHYRENNDPWGCG